MTAENNDIAALIGRLSAILMSVRLAIGADHSWRRLPPALLAAIFVRIKHYAVRFRVIATQPLSPAAPRCPASRPATTTPPTTPPAMRQPARSLIPSRRGWLRHLLPTHYLAPPRAAMIALLASPEMGALINSNPRIGRVLRPLCHMLAIPRPAELRLPSRSPTPKRSRRKPPPAPPSFAPSPIAPWPPPRPRLPNHLYRDDPDYVSNF